MRQTGSTVEMTDDSGAHWTAVAGFNTNPSSEGHFEVLSFVRLDSNRAAIALHQKKVRTTSLSRGTLDIPGGLFI